MRINRSKKTLITIILGLIVSVSLFTVHGQTITQDQSKTVQTTASEATWSFQIRGMVKNTLSFSRGDMSQYPKSEVYAGVSCDGQLIDQGNWQGVRLGLLLDLAGLDARANLLILQASDGYSVNLSLSYIMREDVILAYDKDDQPLSTAPKLVLPGVNGPLWIGLISAITVTTTTSPDPSTTPTPTPTFTATFQVEGIANETQWSMNLAGELQYSTNNTITYKLKSGTYSYTITPIPGYNNYPTTAAITISGAQKNQIILFVPTITQQPISSAIPTQTPDSTPTPTPSPTVAPITTPTVASTVSPTPISIATPTLPPSVAPSVAPTISPTASPVSADITVTYVAVAVVVIIVVVAAYFLMKRKK